MAFMLGKHLVFIDSFQFMSSSLDNLVKNLPNDAFKYTSQVYMKLKIISLIKLQKMALYCAQEILLVNVMLIMYANQY